MSNNLNPYQTQPSRAFWSRSVAKNFDATSVPNAPDKLIRQTDQVMTAGSCFASNIVPYLEKAGIAYIRTEMIPKPFLSLEENFGYRNFSAAYGNIYTPRQLLQLFRRCMGTFKPAEDRWLGEGVVYDPFRPGLRYPARSEAEFELLTEQHLKAVSRAFTKASVFVFTLGLTESWVSKIDGAVFPACPGTIAGHYDPERHEFHNFSVAEVVEDLRTFCSEFRAINSGVRIILTVSPVPLVATATHEHVLCATIYSKSVLRVAANEIVSSTPNVTYFPAYEIVTGPQAPHDSFESDRRSVSRAAVDTVMAALLAKCEILPSLLHVPVPTVSDEKAPLSTSEQLARLGEAIANAECEEAAADLL